MVIGQGSRKIAIIGAGYVGSSVTYALTIRGLSDEIILIDRDQKKAEGEALDICHGIPYMGKANVRTGGYEDCRDCDLIIISAGRNRKPGETRLDLANCNCAILHEIIDEIKPYYTCGPIMIITNPIDILVQKCSEWFDLPNGMIFGTGCLLDSSRLNRLVADYIGISTAAVSGSVVGEHGNSQVPIWSRMSIGGLNISEYCDNVGIRWDAEIRAQLARETCEMGTRIISEKQRTHFGIATCVCMLADAILNQRPTVVPICSPLRGEHGVKDVSLSVPSIISGNGVQQRLREHWTDEEYRGFFDSANIVKKVLQGITD